MSRHWSGGITIDTSERGNPKILLVCEESSGEKESFRWSLPGGKCCSNFKNDASVCCRETKEETLIREYKEETGFDVEPIRVISERVKVGKVNGNHYKKYLFLVKIVGGKPHRKKVPNHESPKWFPMNDLPRNLFFSHRGLIKSFILLMIRNRRSSART